MDVSCAIVCVPFTTILIKYRIDHDGLKMKTIVYLLHAELQYLKSNTHSTVVYMESLLFLNVLFPYITPAVSCKV